MSVSDPAPLVPLVVVFDVMWEASNRLADRILALADADGSEAALLDAIEQLGKIDDRIRSVDVDDRAAILSMDAQLRVELADLPSPW